MFAYNLRGCHRTYICKTYHTELFISSVPRGLSLYFRQKCQFRYLELFAGSPRTQYRTGINLSSIFCSPSAIIDNFEGWVILAFKSVVTIITLSTIMIKECCSENL